LERSTITSNLAFEPWKEVLGSERLAGATLDRRTHRRTIIETTQRELPAPRRQGPNSTSQVNN